MGSELALSVFQKGTIIHGVADILAAKEAEIAQGERVIADLEQIPNISRHKLGRVRGKVAFLKKFVALMKDGFIPIPRMEYEDLAPNSYHGEERGGWFAELTFDSLPAEAITAISSYNYLFTTFGIAPAKKATRKRDPMLIGVLKYGHYEEHFLLGWWRPDMIQPQELW